MSSIYSHCFLSIAATGSANGSESLFRARNAGCLQPIHIEVEDGNLMHYKGGFGMLEAGNYLLMDVHTWKDEVTDDALGVRACKTSISTWQDNMATSMTARFTSHTFCS